MSFNIILFVFNTTINGIIIFRPPPKTATAITKPKVPIAPIERKPLASSATTTRYVNFFNVLNDLV